MKKPLSFFAAGILLAGIAPAALLSAGGCSAAKSVVNANLSDIENPLRLEGRGIRSRVVRNRAFVAASGELEPSTITFSDTSVPSRESLSSANLSQKLNSDLSIVLPNGGAAPDTVTLRNFRLIVTLSDAPVAERQIQFDMVVNGEAVFTRTGNLDANGLPVYHSDSVVEFTSSLNNEQIDRLTAILATPNPDGSAQNSVSATFTCEVDDENLPNGTTDFLFTMGDGSADVKI